MKKGFTLIEALIVIFILIFISSIVIISWRNFQPDIELNNVTRDLVSDLRYLQQLTVTEQVNHGMKFSTTSPAKYQLLRHGTVEEVLSEKVLPNEISFQYISPLTDNEIVFNPYGAVKESANIILVNIKTETKTIKVSPSGFVKIID